MSRITIRPRRGPVSVLPAAVHGDVQGLGILRRHVPLLDFLLHAVASHEAWLPRL